MRQLVLGLTICFSLVISALAADITVTPYQGGSGIRFTGVTRASRENSEVRIRINSTEAEPYQVRQRLVSPIVNERGIRLPDNVLTVSTVRGSNALGTLYMGTGTSLSYSDSLIYSSSSSGAGDSFILVFSLDGRNINDSGRYRGKINFSLIPQGGGTPQNVIVNLEIDASVKLEFTLAPAQGSSWLRLDTASDNTMHNRIICSIKSDIYRNAILTQRVDSQLRNEQGRLLPADVLRFYLSGVRKGNTAFRSKQIIPSHSTAVYSSAQGYAETFYLNFYIDSQALAKTIAGNYRGRLFYTFTAGNMTKTFPIDVLVCVRRVFDIEVSDDDPISFSNVDPTGPVQEKTVTVKVTSNIGRPYQVIQGMPQAMTSQAGDKVPEHLFSQRQSLRKGKTGINNFKNFRGVPRGYSVVFNSDTIGSSAEFDLTYQLTPSYDITWGKYSTKIIYSLSER